jgi:uncharacterized protein YqjF (DUF2071 family)
MLPNTVACTIERRLLVNYRIDPEVVARHLPRPFRPQVVTGWAVGGVCFIRLRGLRPNHFPSTVGITTENVAHRFAVEWDDEAGSHVGVFIPRRDTNSRVTALAGDRVFPGAHRLARFEVEERGAELSLGVKSHDGSLSLSVAAHEGTEMDGQLFTSPDDAIDFFRSGSLGYSPSGPSGHLVGVRLRSHSWDARPVTIDEMRSSVFDDPALFPKGSCALDFGLLMTNLKACWVSEGVLIPHSNAAVAA